MKIVVMGGSFNPPTLAHKILMKEAIKTIDADLGLFVPSSHAYVERKMQKKKVYNTVYSEKQRLEMLNLIAEDIPKSSVSTCEYGDDGRGYTYQTLTTIQSQYPDAQVFFLCGTDNLNYIHKWRVAKKLIPEFHFLVVKREDENPYEIINNNQILKQFESHFVIMPQPQGIEEISSTKIREALNSDNQEVLNSMCPIEVLNYLLKNT